MSCINKRKKRKKFYLTHSSFAVLKVVYTNTRICIKKGNNTTLTIRQSSNANSSSRSTSSNCYCLSRRERIFKMTWQHFLCFFKQNEKLQLHLLQMNDKTKWIVHTHTYSQTHTLTRSLFLLFLFSKNTHSHKLTFHVP